MLIEKENLIAFDKIKQEYLKEDNFCFFFLNSEDQKKYSDCIPKNVTVDTNEKTNFYINKAFGVEVPTNCSLTLIYSGNLTDIEASALYIIEESLSLEKVWIATDELFNAEGLKI
jgi:hypothetical protein